MVPLAGGRPATSPGTEPVRAVLFDMDDTIFDHSATARAALGRLRRTVPALRELPLAAVAQRYGELLDEVFPSVLAGRATQDEARVDRFVRLLAWAGTRIGRADARALSETYRAHYQRLRRPVPGAEGLLRELRGRVTLGIVSNNDQEEQLDKLQAIGLADRFDFVLTSERAGVAKPDPRIFFAALAEAGVRPSEAVMVGDSWNADVQGARAAGIRPVWFNRWAFSMPAGEPVQELRALAPGPRVAAELIRPGAAGAAGTDRATVRVHEG